MRCLIMQIWRASESLRALCSLDLGSVHDSPRLIVERIASMHRGAVVPDDEIANLPDVLPGELRARDIAPEFIKQRYRLGELQADQIGVAPAAEIQQLP